MDNRIFYLVTAISFQNVRNECIQVTPNQTFKILVLTTALKVNEYHILGINLARIKDGGKLPLLASTPQSNHNRINI